VRGAPLRDRRPALRGRAVHTDAQSFNADVARELEIGVAIAHHEAACGLDRIVLQVFLHQAELRLAATAGLVQEMRTDEHRIEDDSLRGEQVEREPVRAIESILRQGRRTQAVLVRHHHQAEPRPLEHDQRRDDMRQQADFLQAVDALIRRLLDERAVAIDE
jgi:hypothetical protein